MRCARGRCRMPRVTSITASRSIKINLGNYESKDAFVSLSVEPEPGEDYRAALEWTEAEAQAEIQKVEAIIRGGDEPMKISDLQARKPDLPTLGTIRKGGKRGTSKRGGFGGGDDLAHFRVEFLEGAESDAAQAFRAKYGAAPTALTVWLPYAEIWRNWRLSFEAYDKTGTLVMATDGDEADSVVKFCRDDKARIGTRYTPGTDPAVKPRARLAVVVEEIGRMGTLDFITTSRIDIERITDALLYYFGPREDGGMGLPCSAVPLYLYRRPEEISVRYQAKDGNMVSQRKEFSLVQLEIAPEWVEQRLLAMRAQSAALARGDAPAAALPAGDFDDYEVDFETGEIIDAAAQLGGEESDDHLLPPPAQNNGATLPGWWGDEPTKLQGLPPTRPWSGVHARLALRHKALRMARERGDRPAASGKRGVLVGALNKLVGNVRRKTLLLMTFGDDSSKTLTDCQCQATLDWLGGDAEIVAAEALNIVAAWWSANRANIVDAIAAEDGVSQAEAAGKLAAAADLPHDATDVKALLV